MSRGLFAALLAGLATFPCASSEQEALSEVIVRGERIARSLSQTASSVVPVTGEEIEQLAGADRMDDLLALVPNVQQGSGTEGPTIRGQDSTGVLRDLSGFLGGARPRATLQVDGRAVSFNEFIFGAAPVWDVEQVEVYRSPQTTTQGRNAIAGAIFVETRDPVWEWEARARLLGGSLDTWQESFALSGPLVEDQLAFRLSGDFRQGLTSTHIAENYNGVDPNRNDHALVRAKLLYEPRDVPGLRVEAGYTHTSSQMPQYEGVTAPFEEREDPGGYGVFEVDVDSFTAVARYPFSPQLSSQTTLSFGNAHIVRNAPPGLGETDTHTKDFSFESVLHWDRPEQIAITGGVHYLQTDLDQLINLSAVVGQGTFIDHQRSLGLFGDVEYRLSEHVLMTAGLRYQRDQQDREGMLAGPGVEFPVDFDETFDAWLPRISLAWETSDALRLGLLVQKAFNPGGTTIALDTGAQQVFAPESLWNYELFLRAAFAQGRGSLSANLFYNDMTDAQRTHPRATVAPGGATAFWSEIINVPAATTKGLEVELEWRLFESLRLRAGAGLLRTRIDETIEPDDPLLHKEFQRSPHATVSAGVVWQPAEQWTVSAQARHHAEYYSNDFNTPALLIDPATVVDARISYDRKNWSVFAYASNLLDEFYMKWLLSPQRGEAGYPRTVGAGVEIRF